MSNASIDTKAAVKVGPFSRGGKSRVAVQAADHGGRRWGTAAGGSLHERARAVVATLEWLAGALRLAS